MRTPSIHQKTSECLADARDDVEHGHQGTNLRERQRIFTHQPRKQRRQHQVKEMRGAVGEPNQ